MATAATSTARVVQLTYLDVVVLPLDVFPVLTPVLVGTLLSSLLLGVIGAQLVTYVVKLSRGETASRVEKTLVAIISLATLINWVGQVTAAHVQLVKNFGQPGSFLVATEESGYVWLAAGAFVNASCQAFFAIRCWRLYKSNRYLGAALGLGLAFCLGAAMLATIKGRIYANTLLGPDVLVAVKSYSAVVFLATAAYDTVVTALLSTKLIRSRRGYNVDTDSMLMRILKLSLTTAFLTTALALILGITVVIGGDATPIFNGVSYFPPRIFAISVLFTIQSKEYITHGDTSTRGGVTGNSRFPTKLATGTHGTTAEGIWVDRVELHSVSTPQGDLANTSTDKFDEKRRVRHAEPAPFDGM